MALAFRGLSSCVTGRGIRQALSYSARVVPAPVTSIRVRSVSTKASAEVPVYNTLEKGEKDTLDYRMFFKHGAKEVSCWHEIPLYAGNGLLHYICEIPKETSAKMEVATDEPCTPIKQDVKKGKLRFYPYNINWNYGMLPQTWEDPGVTNPELQAAGDNDPVDVVEIGTSSAKRGGVYKVKPLGVLAMIDDGELDWKVIAISADDAKADLVNDVEDVEKHFPGEIQKVLEWFRDYKIPDGKPANKFGYDNKCMNKEFTMHVIQETHENYVKLKSGARANTEELSLI
ncbi:hypothetical protein Vretimale_19206 [Volvox reticuliferus]|uniref:inorganic diphosphatase n=1 Tax=Volvox reticuliferus TaxID=1737510 RepID=A0A8J4D398_9CHLO|nr:hypothetical protein Vretifemale_20310 [Volvox reticuliferus]GIM16569.1 hypothetical protein Vretimale_19206 [Volvox reticuliferus]